MVERSRVSDAECIYQTAESPARTDGLSPVELQVLAQSTRDIVLVLCPEGGVKKVYSGVGPGPGIAPGDSMVTHLSEQDAAAFRGAMTRCRDHRHAEPVSFVCRARGGSSRRAFTALLRFLANDEFICIAQDVTAKQAADSALAKRYAVERLLREFSTRFINTTPDRIADAIRQALSEIGEYCAVDRVYLYELTEQREWLVHTHGWRHRRLGGASGCGRRLHAQQLPWIIQTLRARDVVQIPARDRLPAEAAAEQALLREHGVTSLMAAPVIHSGHLQALLGVDNLHVERAWTQDQLHLVASAAEIFASALQRRQSEQRIFRLAYYDRLTGLPNRMLLRKQLRRFLQERPEEPLALVLLDLDDASNINDLLGHDVGDLLLKALAGRLQAFAPAGYPLGRWGADEFLLTLPADEGSDAPVRERIRQLRKVLGEPMEVAGHELRVSSSVGVARRPGDAGSVEALFRFAEMALRQAKQQGRQGLAFYEKELQRRATHRSRLEARMRRALEQRAFELHYQPLVRTDDTARIAGAEALLRWRDPELGFIPPDEFIDVAEETGLIIPLGAWALEQACADLANWREAGLLMPRVSINVSGHQLLDDRLSRTLESALDRHRLPASSLELEITETALMEREKGGLPVLQRLRDLGVGIAVDDFGTGYSSLSKIKHLPVTVLKIDRSFIQDIFTDDNDKAIIIAIVAMAHQLQLRTVAEGVETPEQLAFLRDNGCDLSQGFLHGRAHSAGDMERLLASHTLEATTPGKPVAARRVTPGA